MPLFFTLLMAAAMLPPATPDESLVVVSFNIRYDNPGDSLDAWPHRREGVAALLRFHEADIIGVQEALLHQLEELAARMPEHRWIGVGRDDGRKEGEFSPILLRRDRFEILSDGTFWLSETPADTGSIGWDAQITRVATWAHVRDVRSSRDLFILNTHFDHMGEMARLESARLIRGYVAERAADVPVIITGDFNAVPDSEPIRVLTAEASPVRDAKDLSTLPHYGPESTWNGFRDVVPGRRIDYVFVSDHFEVSRHAALTDRLGGRFPSDHLPVLAELRLKWRAGSSSR